MLSVGQVPLADLLAMPSTEGFLVCASCRRWHTTCDCDGPFRSLGLVPVEELLHLKTGTRLRPILDAFQRGERLPPLLIEHGVLIDGHHRIYAARLLNRSHLLAVTVIDVLDSHIAAYQALVQQHRIG